MQLWNDFLTWFTSPDGTSVLVNGVIPFFAIVVAGFVAAAIGRGSTKRLIALNDRENRVSAIATMIGAARKASVWNTLSVPEQQHAEHVASEADVRVRLLGVTGSGLAADWAAHEFGSMKRNSVSFSFQAEQSLIEFRDRMVTWQAKPSRARKLFKNDLDVWAYEDSQTANTVVSQQQEWAKEQVATQLEPAPAVTSSAATVPVDAAVLTPAPVTPAPVTPAPVTPAPVIVAPTVAAVVVPKAVTAPTVEPTLVPIPAFGLGRRSTPPTEGAGSAGDNLATQAAPVITQDAADRARAMPTTPSWISPAPRVDPVSTNNAAGSDATDSTDSTDSTEPLNTAPQPTLIEPSVLRPHTAALRTTENPTTGATPVSFLDTVPHTGGAGDESGHRDGNS
ncbi:MAG: hypothetical protein H7248_10260 [Microbacteriaceae bacterium]|nr:hypothetical protein [Microbacteriaceae bacterium]